MQNLLIDSQKILEQETFDESCNRQRSDNDKTFARGQWAESKLGRLYVLAATKTFANSVAVFMEGVKEKKMGKHVRAAEKLAATGMDPDQVAYLFTKALFNQIALAHRRKLKRTSFCIRAADLIHDEWRIQTFAAVAERKNLLKKLFKQFDKKTYPREQRKRTIINYFHAEQLEWAGWTTKDKLGVGYALMILFRESTGLIVADKDSQYVFATQALLDDFATNMEKRVLDFTIYKPMVVKPLPWSEDHLFRGGYNNTKLVRRYPLIKGSRKRDIVRLGAMDWSEVIPAVNALQETPWRVNKTILETLEWCMFERGGDMAGLPRADAQPLPPEPEGYYTDEAVKKEHNKLCFLIHNLNREVISKRISVLSTIVIAKKYRNFRAMYFPHNLDSRGRAYPLPAFLNPQGPDYCKSLLEFADGKPIETDEQACWLAIAGANAYGNDKISLQQRVDWVQANDELIFSIASDPTADIRWTQASEPFQFLRFCLEWKGFWDHGFGFVSHMVVPVDATCSGLQHYSAMLRDEVGGKSVNLVPGLSRQDIYQDVADRVVEALMKDGSQIARDWIEFGISRKITKRQVMVVPYAGTFSSCLEYTRSAVLEKIKEGHSCSWDIETFEEHTPRIVLLSQMIWTAIDEVVVKGKEAMRWLSDAARIYTKWANTEDGGAYSKRMSWVTPDGFEAIHFRPEESKRRVETYLDGRVQLTYYEELDRLSSRDMSLAVAPNFVHSMDACHLRMSIVRGMAQGLTHFGMVHDSFGVHAADMHRFLETSVKPAFIAMYQDNLLTEFAARLPATVQDMLSPVPAAGSLDLVGILESEFFFS